MTAPEPTRTPVSDLELMAHADGELTPERAAEVAQALQHDAALADRSAMYRRSRALARAAADAALDEPVPPALVAAVRRAAAAGGGPMASGATDASRRQAPASNAPRYALAASVAALAAGALGYVLGAGAGDAPGTGLAGAPRPAWALPGPPPGDAQGLVVQALSRQASGAGQRLADGSTLTLIASFRDAGGRLCREFGWTAAAGAEAAEGMACHEGSGAHAWRPIVLVQAAAANPGGFRPASGGALDAVARGLAAGPALTPVEEAQALQALPRTP